MDWCTPAILAAPPALVLFDVWEDAENITGMGRELARHESDGKSAAKNLLSAPPATDFPTT